MIGRTERKERDSFLSGRPLITLFISISNFSISLSTAATAPQQEKRGGEGRINSGQAATGYRATTSLSTHSVSSKQKEIRDATASKTAKEV